ncbi:arsenate reductase [Monaibacterium marinum]|uniref:Arsenate reductase n=1 Tax=Pontivivens marinum TaxID=1690039 RepID=A0A2C9CVU7_9RHOB|nr:ArsC/Spx/MgsR family protein [Monaibacterium marinum]SOH94519.1 arsenate reductase [Monaibacterium marinum]
MSVSVYGMPACTTVRKSLKWLEAEGIAHDFTPFAKVADLDASLRDWIEVAGIDKVMNARAATFRALPDDVQQKMTADADFAIAQMVADPRLIKRPVLATDETVLTGFKEPDWRAAL